MQLWPIVLLMPTCIVDLSRESGITLDRHFVMAVPKLNNVWDEYTKMPKIFFYIFTNSPRSIEVTVSKKWMNDTKVDTLTIFTTRPTTYPVDKSHFNVGAPGLKWTYVFQSQKNFGVCLLLFDSSISADTVTLVPVSGWGTIYYAFTMSYTPYIQIMTFMGENEILVALKVGPPNKFTFTYNGQTFKDGNSFKVMLEEYRAFEISECKDRNEMGSLTGTRIVSVHAVGVVCGACKAAVTSKYCDTKENMADLSSTDVMAEMLLPKKSFGKDFILFTLPSRVTPGIFGALAAYNQTKLTIYSGDGGENERNEVTLQNIGEYKELDYANTVGRLTSDKAIQLIYIQRSVCRNWKDYSYGENGDPSFTIVVPTELFFYYYQWAIPGDIRYVRHYALILIKKVYRATVLLDDADLEYVSKNWSYIAGMPSWEMCELSVLEGSHVLRMRNNFYFGCYIYGLGREVSYIHPGGMITGDLDQDSCELTMKNAAIGDMVDNDCDGRIDEEKEDGLDNDNDGRYDEDLSVFEDDSVLNERKRKNATTTTTTTTTRTTTIRRTTAAFTTIATTKRIECPPFKYGHNCAKSCANCVTDCNKEYGGCSECKPGFKYPTRACSFECSHYEYGVHCRGNCYEKCQKDCYERVHGVCGRCLKGSWGPNCSWSCENCVDECDPSYGRCTTCRPGYKNPEAGCREPCGQNQFGQLCQGDCLQKCGRDCFERVFGECNECPFTTWGLNCQETCLNCYNDCNKSTGACTDCYPGFTNPRESCKTPCPPYTFGYRCESTCPNCADDCAKSTGNCTSCKPGYIRPETGCNTPCPLYTWGNKCSKSCVNCIDGCDKETGSCRDCSPGYKNPAGGCDQVCGQMEFGSNCQSSCMEKCGKDCAERVFGECDLCPVGHWGLHCLQSCEHCLEDCHKSFGNCSRCQAGYKYPEKGCIDPCETNEYGQNCEGVCNEHCNGSDCYERVFGECHKCPDFQWGFQCEETCPNCVDPCNTSTGACTLCKAGFKGSQSACKTECGKNEYGDNCVRSCQEKCGKDCFERRFGECEKCPYGKWGLGCAESCENCTTDCDKSYGTCHHCKAGYKRPDKGCIVPCSANEYGEDCIGNCQEKCGHECFERQHGICTGDQYGAWEDWACSRNCSDNRQHRKRFCERSARCHQETQTRDSNCYRGVRCPSECPEFSWGLNCNRTCANCIRDCDKFTGHCVECKRGYKYPSTGCSLGCQVFEYGTDCAGNCRQKCKGADCFERVNGTCIVHGKFSMWGAWRCSKECQSKEEIRYRYCNDPMPAHGGLQCVGERVNRRTQECNLDIKCPEECPDYEWGMNCLNTCPECMTVCSKINGSCKSCRAGYKGAKYGCTTPCDQFEYGEDCSGDCRMVCLGQDCLDRMSGECKPNYFKYIPLVLSMLLLPVLTYWCLSTRNVYDFGYGEEGTEVLENSKYDSSVDFWTDEDYSPEAEIQISKSNEDKISNTKLHVVASADH